MSQNQDSTLRKLELCMDRRHHWELIYEKKSPEETSWYAPHLATSLEWIMEAAPGHSSSIIDVGGGASTLVDDLFANGFRSLTVLDIAGAAIARSQRRLGTTTDEINWIIGDVTSITLPKAAFDIWHDRAVFHFLTEPEQRSSYVEQVANALKPSGQIIIATFATNAPRSCSGLTTRRYDAESLQREFGSSFRLQRRATITHRTPTGTAQEFLYCRMVRV
jgi:2-polyprenyl-3-methyl-5-hydroxy-6-metoxy-1,4-benzoquinol methylase